MSSAATVLRLHPRQPRARRTIDLAPVFPWRLHRHNPTPSPAEPTPPMTRDQLGALPVAWGTQCRDCWGWLDDPRHLTPLSPR